jgi:hypothetical protein
MLDVLNERAILVDGETRAARLANWNIQGREAGADVEPRSRELASQIHGAAGRALLRPLGDELSVAAI